MVFKAGQRWISEMEPELGLGLVIDADRRFVTIRFPGGDFTRKYAVSSAPLRRIEFKAGDTITARDGSQMRVESISSKDDLIVYHGQGVDLLEEELSDGLSFTTPVERLMNGLVDDHRDFILRCRSSEVLSSSRRSSVRGFLGGRIALIPHQLYVAHEISSLSLPRVLLSDETGLGKTIEACLVLHRLLINGRIGRVLILVPNSLVHQWFIELLRRFNLVFRIFDREYCHSIEEMDPKSNPFLEDQLGLCDIGFLASNPKWRRQAIAAKWDMVVIDEAHHLGEDSPEYDLAERLGEAATGLMLLTATPEQLGHRSHFARLVLLDPARYHDYELFEREEKEYDKLVGIVNKIAERIELDEDDLIKWNSISPLHELRSDIDLSALRDDAELRNQVITDLLDRYGTGRAVYRNTRAAIAGLPERLVHLIPLEGREKDLKQCTLEFETDLDGADEEIEFDYTLDPRIVWLAKFLKEKKNRKILLICHTLVKVKAIERALRNRMKINIALFHEGLTLLERDRFAVWFAREGGAQILICSEIGSEGRNFQFCRHLVLFDLPLDPELTEQRIGRLDRIGQTQTIHIHVPYIIGSEGEILARWYHQGLNAFSEFVPGAYLIRHTLGDAVERMARHKDYANLDGFCHRTRRERERISNKLRKGRDRLLELHSFRPDKARELIQAIERLDRDRELDRFMLELFPLYGIEEEQIADRTHRLNLALLSNPEFPLPPFKSDDLIITFDRETALNHENVEYLTWDHPMVIGVLDLLLGSEKGNCALALWPDAGRHEILLELLYMLECIAAKNLHIDRFLPPTPIRIVLDSSQQDRTDQYPFHLLLKHLVNDPLRAVLRDDVMMRERIPAMLRKCETIAQRKAGDILDHALKSMETTMDREVSRLLELKKVNPDIREQQIDLCRNEKEKLRRAVLTARVRLDALRLITCGDRAA